MTLFPNIVSDPEILGGKPCIAGTRISVELIMEWVISGASAAQIAAKHPLLTEELAREAMRYAARFSKNEVVIYVRAMAA